MTTFAATRALSKPAGVDKITVDGVDVTNFRGSRTPTPRFSLMEPLAYGSTSLQFPQVYATYEADNFGTGDLSWVRAGARVVISRTFDADPDVIDYVGVVDAVETFGRILNLEVGGEFAGRASSIDVQNPVVRNPQDVGHWAALACQTIGLNMSPWYGPTTGIELAQTGGQSLLSWVQFVCTMSQDDDGSQRALMPTTWGSSTYEFAAKDYTTKHFTLFPDDARAVLQVTNDATQQPNVWFGSGISPEGVRWQNSKWPGVFQGTPDAYPISGGAPFGLGTTNADTIDGDGIETLRINLEQRGYMPFTSAQSDTYDAAMVKAVKALQRDAGLSVTGTMTTAAWDALFDLSVTGYDVNGAKVFPLVEAPAVRKFNYSATGAVIGRNDSFDPTALRVERTVDFGPGVDKAVARAWCIGQYARALGKNWAGTIELNESGLFLGDHDTEAGLTNADVASFRDVRPGMNVWVPYFDGGTLFHVSGVDVEDGRATLTVDTQARDLMELREVLDRNLSSKRDTRRAWVLQNQPSKASGNMVMADENFGILFNKVHLTGGKWNEFDVIAGQQGQINRIALQLVNDEAQFVVLVASKNMTEHRAHRIFGDPMVVSARSWVEKPAAKEWLRDRKIIYAAGDGSHPCGYWPGRHIDDNGDVTDDPITGEHIDDDPFPYRAVTGTAVLVKVLIWPDRDCVLKRGQIMWPQMDDTV